MASSNSVAIITGGASGMGVSVVEELVRRGTWNVLVLDLNEDAGNKLQPRLGENVSFMQTDVTDYEQLAKGFVATWERYGRLDFVFANAGIGDLQPFFTPTSPRDDGSPAPPNTAVLDVCLTHVAHAAWLALHYFRQNPGEGKGKGRFVATSSMCGLYPGPAIPLYTAAKHGVVGLTRALARRLVSLGETGITVNCICPGLVDTGLTKTTLMPAASPELVTPHGTIVRAVMGFVDDATLTGKVAECSVENVIYREQVPFGDEMAERLMTDDWGKSMREKLAREKAKEEEATA